MGKGAYAAHATYNGTGTQGLATTDKYEEYETRSVFINENDTTRQVLHGCNISEMTCAGKTESYTGTQYKIFTPNLDTDCVGDVFLNFEMDSNIKNIKYTQYEFDNYYYNVDEDSSNYSEEYDLNDPNFTQESRKLDMILGGEYLANLDIDLNSRKVPEPNITYSLDSIGIETVHSTITAHIENIGFAEIIVGKPKSSNGYNCAFRTNHNDNWTPVYVSDLSEVNDVFYYSEYDLLIFGGTTLNTTPYCYLKYSTSSDFFNLNNVFESFVNLPSNEGEDDSGNAVTTPFFKTVKKIIYNGDRVFICGFKDHTTERLMTSDNTDTDLRSIQTVFSLKVNTSSPLDFSYTLEAWRDNWPGYPEYEVGTDQIITSAFDTKLPRFNNVNNNYDLIEEKFVTIGGRSVDMLAVDNYKKLVRSFDNGRTWERVTTFYDGDGVDPDQVATSGYYIDTGLFGNSDPNFRYYMPQIDFLTTNNKGIWVACGKQGKQLDSNHITDKYRQFCFISNNEGFTWYPQLLPALWNPELNYSNNEDRMLIEVEYIGAYTIRWGQLVIIWKAPGNNYQAYNPISGDYRQYDKPTHAIIELMFKPITPALSMIPASTRWIFAPGAYYFPEFQHKLPPDQPQWDHVRPDFDNEYFGAIQNDQRHILYGKNIVTVTESLEPPMTGRYITTRSSHFSNMNVRTVIFGWKGYMVGVFEYTDRNYIAEAVYLPMYTFKKSNDGLNWVDIKFTKVFNLMSNLNDVGSTDGIPILQTDNFGNYLLSVNNNVYKFDPNNLTFDLILDNYFQQVKAINYILNEWIISGIDLTGTRIFMRSYDGNKWRKNYDDVKYNHGGNEYYIDKIFTRSFRHYEPLFKEKTRPATTENGIIRYDSYKSSLKQGYAVWCNTDDGGGLWYYDLTAGLPRHDIVINSEFNPGLSKIHHELNDIIRIRTSARNYPEKDEIIVCGNKYQLVTVGGGGTGTTTPPWVPLFIIHDNPDISSRGYQDYTEAETWFANNGDPLSSRGISSYVDNLKKLHQTPYDNDIIWTIGNYTVNRGGTPEIKYGVIAYRSFTLPEDYYYFGQNTPYPFYWKIFIAPNRADYNPYPTDKKKQWETADEIEDFNDIKSNSLRQIVAVGKGRYANSPNLIYLPKYFQSFKDFKSIRLNFEEIDSVDYINGLWVVGGKPMSTTDGKCLAYTFDLESEIWKYIDFSQPNSDEYEIDYPPSFWREDTNVYGPSSWPPHLTPYRIKDIIFVNYKGYSALVLQAQYTEYREYVNLYHGTKEKIYYLYNHNGKIVIKQNNNLPEPHTSFDFEGAIADFDRPQMIPSFNLIVNNEERVVVSGEYPDDFNMFLVDIKENPTETDAFALSLYLSELFPRRISEGGTKPNQRFRRFLTTEHTSLKEKINGQCYKIEEVKHINFIHAFNSAKYVACGKGRFSPICWSNDLIFWNDTNSNEIFDIVFDVTHKHGTWIAVGSGKYNIGMSKDGKNWVGTYTKYSDNIIVTENDPVFYGFSFNDNTPNNITDVLPYVPEIKGIFLKTLSLMRLFDKIECYVGTQLWQTFTFDDIKCILESEYSSGEYQKIIKSSSIVNVNGSTRLSFCLPIFTRGDYSKLANFYNISEKNCFPSGILNEQKLSIKVYYNKLENLTGSTVYSHNMLTDGKNFDEFMTNTLIPVPRKDNYIIDSIIADNYGFNIGGQTYHNTHGVFSMDFSTTFNRLRLYSKNYELSEYDLNLYRSIGYVSKKRCKITQSVKFNIENKAEMLFNLNNFSLFSSHIILSGWLSEGVFIKSYNLLLNGYTFNKEMEPKIYDYSAVQSLGLNYNHFIFNGRNKDDGTGLIIIPLSSKAFSGSSIPLDKFSTIELKVVLTAVAGSSSYLNVTCIGETIIEYENSTANIQLF